MQIKLTINYNDKGQRLTKTTSYQELIDRDYKMSDDELKKFVYEICPEELIENYSVDYNNVFDSVKSGDWLIIKRTKIERNGTSVSNIMRRVSKVENEKIYFSEFENAFDFFGNEITKKKKDNSILIMPTQEEVNEHLDNIERDNLWMEILSCFLYEGDLDDVTVKSVPYHLDRCDLKSMLKKLKDEEEDDFGFR